MDALEEHYGNPLHDEERIANLFLVVPSGVWDNLFRAFWAKMPIYLSARPLACGSWPAVVDIKICL